MSNSYINRKLYILVILIIISNKVNSKKRGEKDERTKTKNWWENDEN